MREPPTDPPDPRYDAEEAHDDVLKLRLRLEELEDEAAHYGASTEYRAAVDALEKLETKFGECHE